LQMYLPPAGAIAILAMLIPQTELWLYPLEILLGSSLLVICALVFFRDKKAAPSSD